jgi:hypothetical protein
MTFTREQFDEMKEAQLQKDILIPLFREMKYKGITLLQGNGEIGRDIVMYKPGDLEERVNYAVVAKAKRITGKAVGNSTAANVRFQIEQALANPYLDPVTGTTEEIHRCFVVTNKDIIPTTRQAIENVLRSNNINKIVKFIDGNELWGLVEKHLSERAVWNKLSEAKRVMDNADPNWRMTGRITAEGISLSPEPKDLKAALENPPQGSFRFRFPDTPEGQAKREEFDRYIKTGSELKITKEYIEQHDLPEFMKKFLAPILESDYQITTGTLPMPKDVIVVRIEFECDDGETISFDYVPLLKTKGGSEEITLTNQRQKVPWKFEIIHNFDSAQTQVKFNLQYDDVNVKRVLEGFLFLAAVAKGGTLKLEHWESGFGMSEGHVDKGVFPTPEPWWMLMLERLLFIQEKLRIPFVIPKDGVSFDEAKIIYETAHKLEFGRMEPSDITLNIERDGAKEILAWFESDKPYFARLIREDGVIEILGNQVRLGPIKVDILDGYLSQEALTDLRQRIESAAPKDSISIRFEASEERPIIVEYANWLPPKQETSEDNSPLTKEEVDT